MHEIMETYGEAILTAIVSLMVLGVIVWLFWGGFAQVINFLLGGSV